ncbi:unnamed protein product [Penicillium egyptiacum]|uniref:FAD-binding domain-containing protein n=1 Tax=Penicillium egyptiacum TaxID=1303716 RepID=A0A9W4K1W5_9EURO|nr:unnamed protein product [Penicillium egyptiacum]
MAALWMARCGVNARIIDTNITKTYRGRADGLQPRTTEILASFGIAKDILETACSVHESTFWADDGEGGIQHVVRVSEWSPDLGRYPLITTCQGRVERCMLDGMKHYNNLEVERGVKAVDLEVDESTVEDLDAFPIAVTVHHLPEEELLEASTHQTIPQPGDFNYEAEDDAYRTRHLSGKEGSNETIRAKYVIGADGARS